MAISRRTVVAGAAAGALAPHLAWAADDGVGTPVAPKVLRYAFEVAETSLDPAKINDLYSRTLTPHIFEGLYTYDHLARPVKIKPLTADGMPEHSDDFRVWTVARAARHLLRRRPGVQGQAARARRPGLRLLVEALRRPGQQEPGVVGHGDRGLPRPARAAPARARPEEAVRLRPGDRRHPRHRPLHDPLHAEGAAAAIRSRPWPAAISTARSRARWSSSTAPRPRRIRSAPARSSSSSGGAARSSRFERNPDFREMFYDAEPAADDAEGQALLARFKGRRLPMVDRVEISIIEEEQPRWLVVRQRRGRRRLPRRLPVRAAGDAERQGRAQPGQEGDPRLSDHRGGEQLLPVQHGRSGGRRLHRRRRSRCAGRSAWASTRRRSSTTPTWASARWRRARRCRTPPPTTRS